MQRSLKNINDKNLYSLLGKTILFAGFSVSVLIVAAAFVIGKNKQDYYCKLRQSYEGLSPDEY